MTITEERIAAIEARLAAATVGLEDTRWLLDKIDLLTRVIWFAAPEPDMVEWQRNTENNDWFGLRGELSHLIGD